MASPIPNIRVVEIDDYSLRATATPYPVDPPVIAGQNGEYPNPRHIDAVFELLEDPRVESAYYEGGKLKKVVVDLTKLSSEELKQGWIEGIWARTAPERSPRVTEEKWELVKVRFIPIVTNKTTNSQNLHGFF